MTQRSSLTSRLAIGLGLAFTGAIVALPSLTPSSLPTRVVRMYTPPVSVSSTWFGQAWGSLAPEASRSSFWLGEERAAYVPISTWRYTELSDGSARLSCLFAESRDESKRWWFDVQLGAAQATGALGFPVKSTHEGLSFEDGGVSDSMERGRWTQMSGSLRGQGALAGALIELRQEHGSALQVGRGASNADAEFGLQGRFTYEVVAAPTSGAQLGLETESGLGGFRARLTTEDASFVMNPEGRGVLALPGIGRELVFVSGGHFEQRADGTARLSGVVARNDDRDVTFALELAFAGARTPGEAAYPPAGSPTHEFPSEAYAQYGGDINDQAWSYYESMSGTLTGLGEFRGALVQLESEGPAFQVGVGANGVSAAFGGACFVTATTVSQPDSDRSLPDDACGDLRVELGRSSVQLVTCVDSSAEGHKGRGHSLSLPGLGHDFGFTSGGQLVEQPDGSARLTGEMARKSQPSTRLAIDFTFRGRTGAESAGLAASFQPRRQLHSFAYIEQGGLVDTGTWHAYGEVQGSLFGLGDLSGVRYEVQGSSLQVGVGANGRNLDYGGSAELVATLVSTPSVSAQYPEQVRGSMAFALENGGRESVLGSHLGSAPGAGAGGSGLRINGLGNDFIFTSGGEFVQRADGSASLSGVVARRSFPQQRFFLETELGLRRDPGSAGYPPIGSPKLSLPSDLLSESGGMVAPGSWTYYERVEGQLYGLDDFSGARISFERQGPALQVGIGANNRDADYGATGWIGFEIEQAPEHATGFPETLGRGELTLEPQRKFTSRAEEAIAIAAVQLPAGHALSLPGLATDLVFAGGGEFREFSDGTASLTGVVARATDLDKSFDVLLDFKGRVDPGFGNYPPQGSPLLELPTLAYVDRGGVVDPARWHYFESVEGILVGTGEWAGSLLEVRDLGGATQVGHGANGRNFQHGASAVLDVQVIQSPQAAGDWPQGHLQGRLDIDLESASF